MFSYKGSIAERIVEKVSSVYQNRLDAPKVSLKKGILIPKSPLLKEGFRRDRYPLQFFKHPLSNRLHHLAFIRRKYGCSTTFEPIFFSKPLGSFLEILDVACPLQTQTQGVDNRHPSFHVGRGSHIFHLTKTRDKIPYFRDASCWEIGDFSCVRLPVVQDWVNST